MEDTPAQDIGHFPFKKLCWEKNWAQMLWRSNEVHGRQNSQEMKSKQQFRMKFAFPLVYLKQMGLRKQFWKLKNAAPSLRD